MIETTVDLHREKSRYVGLANAAIIGVLAMIILIHIGFFNTYIRHFPKFEDANVENFHPMHFTLVQHFHGMMMMGWVLMLLVQPLLIRTGRFDWHRRVGYTSYVLASLVVLSMFLINKSAYNRVLASFGEVQGVAVLALTFPALVFFITFYLLALRYKHRPDLHMRFMCSTILLFIPPALDRLLIVFFNLPGYDIGSLFELAIIGTIVIGDSTVTKRVSPFILVFAFEVLHKMLWHSRETEMWQAVGTAIAKMF